ncbi:hypothetical protein BOTBODRAFT_34254 [Botryobasidium botryosum FD-172 SS1]|uniref:peptidyl-tRNA hydrolase n=1 Tax=Botryobasidium botryosum (strain FD-172 SS1) TaxID=930990 RepID=A0A067MMK9_BOTB1|nr:hypothetical protein BOTBODRAFT_34254 [Botryobasidium botryosum FD-172 SS1]
MTAEGPTQMATYIAVAILSLTVGYWVGVGSSLGFSRGPPEIRRKEKDSDGEEDDEDVGGSDEEDASGDGDLASVSAGMIEECKLVLVVRTDLGMTKGKIAAQCSHATLACYKTLSKSNPSLLKHWERTGQAKIALRCDSEDELLLLQATAQSLNLCARSIQDAGRTQIAAGSRTVLGIGPAPVKLINQVTGALKLL